MAPIKGLIKIEKVHSEVKTQLITRGYFVKHGTAFSIWDASYSWRNHIMFFSTKADFEKKPRKAKRITIVDNVNMSSSLNNMALS
jgi:hypothetical protein